MTYTYIFFCSKFWSVSGILGVFFFWVYSRVTHRMLVTWLIYSLSMTWLIYCDMTFSLRWPIPNEKKGNENACVHLSWLIACVWRDPHMNCPWRDCFIQDKPLLLRWPIPNGKIWKHKRLYTFGVTYPMRVRWLTYSLSMTWLTTWLLHCDDPFQMEKNGNKNARIYLAWLIPCVWCYSYIFYHVVENVWVEKSHHMTPSLWWLIPNEKK